MSDDSANGISEENIEVLQNTFGQIAAIFLFWGIQLCLAVQATVILVKRGIRKSKSRQFLVAILMIMLASSTTFSIIYLEYMVIQMPILAVDVTPESIVRRLTNYTITFGWLTRLNFALSDLIVVWRAWALWPNSKRVRITLAVCMSVAFVCSIIDATLVTLGDRGTQTFSSQKAWDLDLQFLLYIPLLATNIFSTGVIGYKAWKHRVDTLGLLKPAEAPVITRVSNFRVERVLVLLVETGAFYILYWVIFIIADYKVFMTSRDGMVFTNIWQALLVDIAGIYPTIIVLLVALYMSNEVTYGDSAVVDLTRPSGSPHFKGPIGSIRFTSEHSATNSVDDSAFTP